MKKIAPSILSSDFGNLAREIRAVEEAGADYIHIDVMDGHFVPNLTVGPIVVECVRKLTRLPLDVHLMVERPENLLDAFIKAGSDIITVHVEATPHLHRAIQSIKEKGAKAGVSLNPSTPIQGIEPVIEDVDMVVIMSVNPGFGGQELIRSALAKIKRVRKLLDEAGSKAELEVDGGIKAENIRDVSLAGADVFVSGSGIFKTKDYKKTIAEMRKRIG
ncbi:MAG TPA: ribulose-phosphate 3-epimerase [Thermodesulfobacteriota bacterium]|nr:ribulose-phosphate 3-epimerase [Thermodesulfobacteriota bacterium]